MGSYQAALLLQMRGASSNTKQIFLLMILMVGKKKWGGEGVGVLELIIMGELTKIKRS